MSNYYDRYCSFRQEGKIRLIPNLKIEKDGGDLYIKYDKSKMRLDSLSYKYYGDPNYGWLIMLANPKLGSMEFEIPDASIMRIPYPLSSAITRYENDVKRANSF